MSRVVVGRQGSFAQLQSLVRAIRTALWEQYWASRSWEVDDTDARHPRLLATALHVVAADRALRVTEPVLAELQAYDYRTRERSAKVLAELGAGIARTEQALEVLTSLLKRFGSEDGAARHAAEAIESLAPAFIGTERAREVVSALVGELASKKLIGAMFDGSGERFGEQPESSFAKVLGKLGVSLGGTDQLSGIVDALVEGVEGVGNPKRWIRSASAEALGKLGPAVARSGVVQKVIRALVEMIERETDEMRVAPARALGAFCELVPDSEDTRLVAPALIRGLAEGDWDVRFAIAEVIGRLGSFLRGNLESVAGELVERLRHCNDSLTRAASATALGSLGAVLAESSRRSSVVEVLIDALTSDDDELVRSRSAVAIGKLGPVLAAVEVRLAIGALAERLACKDWLVGIFAARALGDLGGALEKGEHLSAVSGALIGGLSKCEAQDTLRTACADALGKVGAPLGKSEHAPAVVGLLLEGINAYNDHYRWASANALARVGMSPGAIVKLVAGLRDESPFVRQRYAQALSILGPNLVADDLPVVVGALAERLRQDQDRNVRSASAGALGKLEQPLTGSEELSETIAALVQTMRHDEHYWVRHAAADALGNMGAAIVEGDQMTAAVGALVERLHRAYNAPPAVTHSAEMLHRLAATGIRFRVRDRAFPQRPEVFRASEGPARS